MRQNLLPQIVPVHIEGPRLPNPFVTLEHGLGDGLEERLVGPERHGLASPDRGKHLGGAEPCLVHTRGAGIAKDPPDTHLTMLTMDEEVLPA